MIPITIAPGSINKPESIGEIPRIVCTYIGIKIIAENIATAMTMEIADDKANIGYLKIRNSSIGSSIRN